MLGRGLAAVGLTVGTVEQLGPDRPTSDQTNATSTPPQDAAPTGDATTTTAASTTEASASIVAESQAGTAPDNGGSTLLIAIAVGAALGAALLGWFGWRSR